MRQILIIGLLILLAGCGKSVVGTRASSFDDAIQLAAKEKKPIFLEFYAPW